MELEILKLIYDYSISGKLVDLQFINKLIEIIVTKKGFDDYVRNVKFTSKLNKTDDVVCAAYKPVIKDILVDYEAIKIVLNNRNKYECLFGNLEKFMFRNLVITQIILHELEHAYQFKQADNNQDNSIEAKLIRASFVLGLALKNPKFLSALNSGEISEQDFDIYLSHNRELYNRYYLLNPTERLAEVNSFRTLVNTVEPLKKYIPNLYEFEYASLVERMLIGYQESWNEGICPAQVYLYGTRQSKIWTEFDFYSQNPNQLMNNVIEQYSLNRRLSLGLPVSYDEYDSINNWLQTTNKFNF